MNKQELYDLVDNLDFATVFEELDKLEGQNLTMLNALRNECITLGVKDIYFCSRLKMFIQTLKTPQKDALNVVVLTATKDQIDAVGKKNELPMPLDRYDETKLENWQPFESKDKVHELFAEYKTRKGYAIDYQCVAHHACDTQEEREWVKEKRKNMVLWVDLLAVCEKNKKFVSYFNDSEIGGLLTSICHTDSKKVKDFWQTQTTTYFENRKDEFENYGGNCTHIALGVPNKEWLFRLFTNLAVLHGVVRNIEKEDKTGIRKLDF